MPGTSLSTNQNILVIAVASWRHLRSACLNEVVLQWHHKLSTEGWRAFRSPVGLEFFGLIRVLDLTVLGVS